MLIHMGDKVKEIRVYSAIENRNRTWIAKYKGTIEGHVQYMKDRNGYSGIALSEVNTIK